MSKAEYSLVMSAEVWPFDQRENQVFLDKSARRRAGEDCRALSPRPGEAAAAASSGR